MTGDGRSIGSKHGIGFEGEWVWGMKDYIDMSFMNLFNPKYLFEDYEKNGTKYPKDNFALFDDVSDDQKELINSLKLKVGDLEPEQAAKLIKNEEGSPDYLERF